MKTLVLVDGSSYLYRAFHALPSLANSKGFPTGAVYGVVNMLRRLQLDYPTDHFAVVFDAKGKTFRDDMYEHYKANRTAMPDELSEQISVIHEIIEAMGIPILMVEGVEADDVIGTLASAAEKNNFRIIVSTGDKDLAQLVNDHTMLINTMSNTIYDTAEVQRKFGITPELVVDYLALIGDSIDNIPGIPMVGPKTAVKWLTEYGNLDTIIANANAIKGKVGENLRACLEQLPLSKELATIKRDVPLAVHVTDLIKAPTNHTQLIELYRELEFKTWLAELLSKNPESNRTKKQKYDVILTEDYLKEWLEKLNTCKQFSFSVETTTLDYRNAQLVGIAFSLDNQTAYLPLAHEVEDRTTQLTLLQTLDRIKLILENPTILKITHDSKFAMHVLAQTGIKLSGPFEDTLLQAYVLDSTAGNQSLYTLALKYLGDKITSYEEMVGKGTKQILFSKVSIEQASLYAAQKATVTLQLYYYLSEKLAKEKGLSHIYNDIELPLAGVLARIEQNGVLIDCHKLTAQNSELCKRLTTLETDTYKHAGIEFNLGSPKQLQEILYQRLSLPILQKTPKGQPSTAEAVLQELALDYELPKLIIEHRGISKLISTYTQRLPQLVHDKTKRVHTSYNQTGASTGRLSSSEPNLQNIPIRTPEGRKIRQAFIASENHQIICADYSQIELRIMAHISGDPTLRHSFEQGLDIHQATAAEVLDIPLDNVTSEQRRNAKAINFGLIYGMSAFGLAKQLGIDRQAAQTYIDRYFERYPNVRQYMETTRIKAHELGYVETLWGRRLYIPDINSQQIFRQKAAERAAINAPLQGSAADIIKRAMISLDEWIHKHAEFGVKMIMQVHDELVFEVPDKNVDNCLSIIPKHMVDAGQLALPLVVSIGAGKNWDEASKH